MKIACLDLEGVLIPEVWINFAKRVEIPELERTTRDEPDYDRLMTRRLEILEENRLGLPEIQEVIEGMEPLEGAKAFLDDLRARFQVIILSDTFYQFSAPFMRKLGLPTLFCHRLEVGPGGEICGYRLRQKDGKRAAVRALQSLNFPVIATGDSYNDTTMLGAADRGILFRPPRNVVEEFPQFPVTHTYEALSDAFALAEAELDAES